MSQNTLRKWVSVIALFLVFWGSFLGWVRINSLQSLQMTQEEFDVLPLLLRVDSHLVLFVGGMVLLVAFGWLAFIVTRDDRSKP